MQTNHKQSALDFAQTIIVRVSRTFAGGIQLLPGDLGKAVLIGYLFCRIADTIEDDILLPASQRHELLTQFMQCFTDRANIAPFVSATSVVRGEEAYLELLRNTSLVFTILDTLAEPAQLSIQHWVSELAAGMRKFVDRHPQGIRIQTLTEFKEYCYYVAGTVGHLLTDLFAFYSPWIDQKKYQQLIAKAEIFGEALQMLNILKDISSDYKNENAVFIPAEILQAAGCSQEFIVADEWRTQNHQALAPVFDLAQKNLDAALEYCKLLPRRAFRIRQFCLLPVFYGIATLRELRKSTAMLQPGGQVKITRQEVYVLTRASYFAALSNKAIDWIAEKTRTS